MCCVVQESQLAELLEQLMEVEGGGESALSLPERCVQPSVSSLTEEDLTFDTDAAAADLITQSVPIATAAASSKLSSVGGVGGQF